MTLPLSFFILLSFSLLSIGVTVFLIGLLACPVVISVTKEGVKFSTRGDIGTANIVCRQNTTVDKACHFS